MAIDAKRLRVAILGPLLVEQSGVDVTPRSGLQRRLLAMLILRSPHSVSADALIDVGWPDGNVPKAPRENLQTHLSRLRSQLGGGSMGTLITGEAGAYRLVTDAVSSDLDELSTLTAVPEHHDGRDGLARIEQAIALWRGPSLADIADTDAAMGEAVRLDELRLSLQEARLEQLSRLGPHPRLVSDLEAFTLEHPYREGPHALLMEVLYHLGRQADALAVYKRLRTRLADDLGLEPSSRLRELESEILGQRVSPAPETPLKAGASGAGTSVRPTGPPAAVTSLVGRKDDLDRVRRGFERSRLVTITGPGGVGKTRLALEIGRQLAERDGQRPVVWCDLTPAADETEVLDIVALTLGAHRRGNGSQRDAILDATIGAGSTVMLDSCEHVNESVAELITEMLAVSPTVQVVATARSPLEVVGEELIVLDPISCDATRDSPDRPPAVELFWQRSSAAGATLIDDAETLTSMTQVCRAVDGLPLGIELAAAQLRNMTLAEVADRVKETTGALDMTRKSGNERHRSLRSALSWSLDTLPVADRRFFEMLSVFPGSFDAAAAAAVADSTDVDAVASRLRDLSDLCLITVDAAGTRSRFRLLRTARLLGHERADADGLVPDLVGRHRDWFVRLVENAAPLLRGPAEADAVRVLELEIDNIRSVARRALADGDIDVALTVAAAVSDYSLHRLRDDIIDWSEMSLEIDGVDQHPLYASALGTLAMGVTNRGDLERAEALARQAINIGTTDTFALLHAHHALALCALYSGRLAEARTAAADHLLLAEVAHEVYDSQFAAMITALAAHYEDECDEAIAWAQRSWALAEQCGAPSSLAWAHYVFGEVSADADPAQAQSHFESAIELGALVHNELVVGVARLSLTTLPLEAGHEDTVLRAYEQLIGGWRLGNDWTHQWTTLQNLVPLLIRCGAHVDAAVILSALTSDGGEARIFGHAADEIDSIRTDLAHRLGDEQFDRLEVLAASLDARQVVERALDAITRLLTDGTARALARQ